jgi:hypothetical protein
LKLNAQKKFNHPKSKKNAEKFPKLGHLTVGGHNLISIFYKMQGKS